MKTKLKKKILPAFQWKPSSKKRSYQRFNENQAQKKRSYQHFNEKKDPTSVSMKTKLKKRSYQHFNENQAKEMFYWDAFLESRVICTFIGNLFDSCLRPRKVEGALIMRTVFLRQAESIEHEDRIPTTSREHSSWGPYSYDNQRALSMRTLFLR